MKLRRSGVLASLVILALLVYACVSLWGMHQKLQNAAQTQAELQREVTALEGQNAALEYAIENAEDPEVIAGVARDKLGLVMPDDQIFRDGGN